MSLDFYLHYRCDKNSIQVFSTNITHNLNTMAEKAGIYKALWRPEEIGAKKAKDIISLLEDGVKQMKSKPKYFSKYNAKNGWGTYAVFLPWVEDVLQNCKQYPNARIGVSR